MSARVVADRHGISRERLRQLAVEYELPTARHAIAQSRALEAWRVALSQPWDGTTLAMVARANQASLPTLRVNCGKAGVPLTHPGAPTDIGRAVERWRDVKFGRLPPESIRACALASGVKYKRLLAHLKRI